MGRGTQYYGLEISFTCFEILCIYLEFGFSNQEAPPLDLLFGRRKRGRRQSILDASSRYQGVTKGVAMARLFSGKTDCSS